MTRGRTTLHRLGLHRLSMGVLPLLLVAAEENFDESDIKAGWTAFVVFIVLILAMAFLGWSLTKRLKNVDRAEEEGRYDPSPRRRAAAQQKAQQNAQQKEAQDEAGQDDAVTPDAPDAADGDPDEPRG